MGEEKEGKTVSYKSVRKDESGAGIEVRYTPGEALGASEPGTLEHFLLERYYLYVERRGQLYQGQVHHVPYPAHRAEVHALYETLIAAAGLPQTEGLPELAHYSPGVEVEVFGPWPYPKS